MPTAITASAMTMATARSAPGAERDRTDLASEAVPAGAPAQVVELVEVGVLAEGRPDAAREDRHLGALVVPLRPLPRDGDGIGGLEALVRETAEVARQARAAAHLQPAHLGVGEQAVLGQFPPEQGDLGQAAGVPPPRTDDGAHPVAIARQQRDDHLAEGQQGGLRQHPHQAETGVALEHGAQLVASLEHLHGDPVASLVHAEDGQGLQATRDGLAVPHARLGCDDHTRPRHLAAPRKVEVLAHGHDPGVEALQLGEQVSPRQNAPARGDEHVADGVVLAMVDLALDDAVDDGAGLVAAHPDVQEDARVVPVDELRGHHAGVGAERLLDHVVDGVGVERDVVMAQQVEGRALHHAEHLVGGRGVAGPPGQVPHERVREDAPHPLGDLRAVVTRGEDQDRELSVVLGGQGCEGLFEPGPGIGRDHDGDHGRHLGVHQVPEAIRFTIGPSGTEFTPHCLLLFNKGDTLARERRGLAGGPLRAALRSEPTRQEALMPDVTTNITTLSKGVTDLARDAAYVAVGLGVLGYQRAQVQRIGLQNRLSGDVALDQRIGEVRDSVAKGMRHVDDLAESAVQFVETTLQPLEDKLPPTVTQLTSKAREQAREVRTQIRQLVNS